MPLSKFVCQSCAYESPRWTGKCPNCGAWNSFLEELAKKSSPGRKAGRSSARALRLGEVELVDEERIATQSPEVDRVLGGGIVAGSVILLGGDPGIGKSTLMMQLASRIRGRCVLYISGEESAKQIKLRSLRLGTAESESFLILTETDLNAISELIDRNPPDVIIVDSVQTMVRPELEATAGSVSQVRESTAFFTRIAKEKTIPVFLIGHVTKDGVIAGPKVIEHMVDAVLQFEGDQHHAYRILRAVKNRFGSTDEIGVFEMRDTGLREVGNPSEVFLSQRSLGSSGSMVAATIEGTRPILVEVQALVTTSSRTVPERNTTGVDYRRLGLLLAVLEKRLGMTLGRQDVFVNIAGGIRIDEPAVDLSIALAIVSSMRDRAIDAGSVAIGEIGLSGEVRTVGQIEKRLQEAAKLGFQRVLIPALSLKGLQPPKGIDVIGIGRIDEAVGILFT
ncbi:MAG TPA: DNA repair protein RadA [Bacteroidota bacterium]